MSTIVRSQARFEKECFVTRVSLVFIHGSFHDYSCQKVLPPVRYLTQFSEVTVFRNLLIIQSLPAFSLLVFEVMLVVRCCVDLI